jgi:hypothetical protein
MVRIDARRLLFRTLDDFSCAVSGGHGRKGGAQGTRRRRLEKPLRIFRGSLRSEKTMADNDKRKFDLPWATLLPLVAILAGVVATYKPLVSERPSVASEKTTPVIAAQDVDARLWQDPIGVAQKQKALQLARFFRNWKMSGIGRRQGRFRPG